jgi:succinate-semialdehyde dehydrogenase/glutarate-semialdehyde dehydrogenase
VLSGVLLVVRIMNDDPFGPVAPLNRYEDMIVECNRLPFGLAAYSWARDGRRQERLAREVEIGMLCIKRMMLVGSDTPFRGVKWSEHRHEDMPEGVASIILKTVYEG